MAAAALSHGDRGRAGAYLERHGRPLRAADLERHACLRHLQWQRRSECVLHDGEHAVPWPERTRFSSNQGESLRMAAVRGLGVLIQPEVLLVDDLASGRLVSLLEHCVPPPREVSLVYSPDLRQLPKLKVFIAYLVERIGAVE